MKVLPVNDHGLIELIVLRFEPALCSEVGGIGCIHTGWDGHVFKRHRLDDHFSSVI